jgi:hypothetical protein
MYDSPSSETLTAMSMKITESESYVTTDGHLASLSWNKAPSGAYDQIFITCVTITVLFLWGTLSDERSGLSFVYAAGPCQRSLSGVRVPWDCLTFETSLFVASYDSQGHGGGIRPHLHTSYENYCFLRCNTVKSDSYRRFGNILLSYSQ